MIESSARLAASVSHISLMQRPYGPRIHMDENASSAPAGPEPAPVIAPANLDSTDTYSPEQAFEAYQKKTNPAAESAEPATAENKLAQANDGSDENLTPAEEPEGNDPDAEKLPPIERPRSWSKDDDDDWNALPRARQEKIAANERARESDISQRINEAAAERKAAQAEREQAGQERKVLAAKLPEVERAVQEFLAHKYPDIKSMDDVVRMAHDAERLWPTDPFAAGEIGARLKAWEVDQQRISLSLADAKAAQAGEARERESNLLKYRADETSKLAEFVPEINNPDELKALTTKAVNHLKGFDFSDDQLNEYAAQGDKPFIFSAGFQRILLNSLKYEQLKAAPVKAVPKDVPAVQRPGVAPPKGAQAAESVQALRNKLTGTGSVDDAFALYQAKQRRRS